MECLLKDIIVQYKECGRGRPILMIHGYYPDHRLMTGCMEPVFETRPGYRRIYIDLPGMGRTQSKYWIKNSDHMLDVVMRFAEQVIPGERFLVAGESYGGYLARGLVHEAADRLDGVLLLCPMVIPDKDKRQLPPHAALVEDKALMSRLTAEEAEDFRSMAVVQSEALWQRYKEEIYEGVKIADDDFLTRLRQNGYAFSFDVDTLPAPFMKPTVILQGRQDASTGYKDAWDILDNYPRGTFAVLDRAGHNLQIEQPELFKALVLEWLDRVEEMAAPV